MLYCIQVWECDDFPVAEDVKSVSSKIGFSACSQPVELWHECAGNEGGLFGLDKHHFVVGISGQEVFSEQAYRNTFTRGNFDWFGFNQHLAKKVCTGSFLALAVDPSYIPKSGKKTPWFGKFWSGAAGEAKKGLELMGIGLIDVDNRECMTLGAFQTPDSMTLEDMDYNLIDWYREQLISRKDRLLPITRTIVADAFFSKETFVRPLVKEEFNVVSRLRNDAVLFYPTTESPTGKLGRPKLYDGKVDFANLDTSRCEEIPVDNGRLFGLRAYSKSLKGYVKIAVWYPLEGRTDRWKIYFSTDVSMSTKDVINCYRARFLLEFCFRDAKSFAGLTTWTHSTSRSAAACTVLPWSA